MRCWYEFCFCNKKNGKVVFCEDKPVIRVIGSSKAEALRKLRRLEKSHKEFWIRDITEIDDRR